MGYWLDLRTEDEYSWDEPTLKIVTTDNPIVMELLGPDGELLRQWAERPPVGFR